MYNGISDQFSPSSFLNSIWDVQKHLAGCFLFDLIYLQKATQKKTHMNFLYQFWILFILILVNYYYYKYSSSYQQLYTFLVGLKNVDNCQCIIHKVFGGILHSQVTCKKCFNITSKNVNNQFNKRIQFWIFLWI